MSIREVIATINQMEADGIIDRYAIGGAVAATFYLEPVATLDIDVFVAFRPEPGQLIATPKAIFDYLTARGCSMKGEYVMIAGWPVQFLPPTGPLVEEALAEATQQDVDGVPPRGLSDNSSPTGHDLLTPCNSRKQTQAAARARVAADR